MLERYIPSMFARRLVLLVAVIAFSLLMLVGKVGHLTLIKGDKLRAEAAARMVRTRWTPTFRGRILDRKGRLLAADRASYDLAVGYPMISGEWADDKALAFVRKFYREQWADLSPQERDELVAAAKPAYVEHLERAWSSLAEVSHNGVDLLKENAAEVRASVQSRFNAVKNAGIDRERLAANERGEPITPQLDKEIEKRASLPIREMKSAHRLLTRVPDDVAFDAQFMVGQTTEIHPLPAETGPRAVDLVEVIPGLAVFDAGDRDYPFEQADAEIDRSTLPSPIRSDSKQVIAVRGALGHVVGWMRDTVYADDNRQLDETTGKLIGGRLFELQQDPRLSERAFVETPAGRVDRGEYRDGDRVGSVGAEAGFESTLRGLRGRVARHLDSGAEEKLAAEPGRDVTLTIDAALQARIHAIMSPEVGLAKVQPWHRSPTEEPNPTMPDGTPINGAAAVLDIDTGEVLALVSTPAISRDLLKNNSAMAKDAVNVPFINRPIARAYPPGSIVKPLILCGAVQRGAFMIGQTIACNGHLLPNDENKYRCWIFKRSQKTDRLTHSMTFGHDLAAPEAIMVSCNVFFFTLGQRLSGSGIASVYNEFGVGSIFALGIGEESRGGIGVKGDGSDLQPWDAIQMGIGQGPVTWTPLHAASAYATLARYGYLVPPRITRGGKPRQVVDLGLNNQAVLAALDGLRLSVNDERGTGHHLTLGDGAREPIFNAPGVTVWGKTGTAEAPTIYGPSEKVEAVVEQPDPGEEHDGENPSPQRKSPPRPVLRKGDHSWFVILVGNQGDNPKYAISVVMEYAGSGGKVSGPICNQIIHALIAEGYLGPPRQ